ncbi:hypothetical protein LTR95_010411, partial [Oleoguttula sp. CCFEE 5521]
AITASHFVHKTHEQHHCLMPHNYQRSVLVAAHPEWWREWSFVEAIYAIFNLDSHDHFTGISPFSLLGTDRSNFVQILDKLSGHDITIKEARKACAAFENGGFHAMRFLEQVVEGLSNPEDTSWRGHYFVTEQGLVGFGPADVEVDDVVVVLSGAHVPFVLRPVGSEFALLGDAYVHGLMRGAVRIKAERGEIELEEFVLL